MNISYNRLCELLPLVARHTPSELGEILTAIGLEVGSIKEVEAIPGGLKGVVIGEVLTCVPHPNSDHLHITEVNVGSDEPLQIVCGAPNVAQGQRVPVATVGTVLYDGSTSFTIKKSKLRGEVSLGMICSEKELGIGDDSSGIMVLPEEASIGLPMAEYLQLASDYCLEIDITPNRVDATSHFGVARDLAAYFSARGEQARATLPEAYCLDTATSQPAVEVELLVDATTCPRYSGIALKKVSNGESPQEIKDFLTTIGLKPINLLVDISNVVLHEVGQPIHIFDLDKLPSKKIKVQHLPQGTAYTTLDGATYKLNGREIMITDSEDTPLCMAGIYGGKVAEVTRETTHVFIESANFHSTTIRKAARYHGLSTDSSFRFERGLSPEATDYALRRTLFLIHKYSTAEADGGVVDLIPAPLPSYSCTLSLSYLKRLVGGTIPLATIKRILEALDIVITSETAEELELKLPSYRTDVRRSADVAEEILRIYGYNELPLSGYITANLSGKSEQDTLYQSQLRLSEQLVGAGYSEILCNSLTSAKYYESLSSLSPERLVELRNPLSGELAVMRQTLLFGGLEVIGRNSRNKQAYSLFFEWGNVYRTSPQEKETKKAFNAGEEILRGYQEVPMLGLWSSGVLQKDSWATPPKKTTFFRLKGEVENIFLRLGVSTSTLSQIVCESSDLFVSELQYIAPSGDTLCRMGEVAPTILERAGIEQPVFFAELRQDLLFRLASNYKLYVGEINKFPAVTRDFALLIDEGITYSELLDVAKQAGGKLLRDVKLFDVYSGKNLPEGKVSYALRFRLQDEKGTLTDKQIDKAMSTIRRQLEEKLGATIR